LRPGQALFPGIKDGAVSLWPFSNEVDQVTRRAVSAVWENMRQGNEGVFCGDKLRKDGPDGPTPIPSSNYINGDASSCLNDVSLDLMMYRVVGVEFLDAKETKWGAIQTRDGVSIFYKPEYDFVYPVWMGAIFMLFGAIGIVVVLCTFCFMHKHRKNRWFKSHSVDLMFVILLGVLLLMIMPFVLYAQRSQEICSLTRFMAHFAFIVIAAPICLKTYRLHKFFAAARHLRTASCTTKQLFTVILCSITAFFVYSVIWFLYAPPTVTRNYKRNLDIFVTSCSSPTIWDLGILIPEVLVLLSVLQLVVLIRSIPKQFNESKYIAFTLYTVLVMGGILLPLALSIEDEEPLLTYFLENFGIFVVSWAIYASLFGVKIQKIVKNENYSSKVRLPKRGSRSISKSIRLKATNATMSASASAANYSESVKSSNGLLSDP